MATSFVISCPECDKKIKVSDELAGKKIRCKECEAVFTVKAPKTAPAKPAKAPEARPVAEEKKASDALKKPLNEDDDDEGGPGRSANPYALEATDDHLPRCPFCAKEMESEEAIICLNCGYNTRTRTRNDTRKVHEATGTDKFVWLLPGIASAIVVIALIATDVVCWLKMKEWATGSWMQDDKEPDKWIIRPHAFTLYISLAMAAVAIPLGKFAFRRLVLNNKPPERPLEKDDTFEDDD